MVVRFRAAVATSALAAAVVACVDVPDSIRAQFAAPGPDERSNFRRGPHGLAPPNEEPAPAVEKAAETTEGGAPEDAGGEPDTSAPDASAPEAPADGDDGGVS